MGGGSNNKRKRVRFDPSEILQSMILELAGVKNAPDSVYKNSDILSDVNNNQQENGHQQPSETSDADPETVRKDATRLKHQADKADGAARYLLYLRSALRYIEYAEKVTDHQAIETLGSTALLLEFAAKKSNGLCQRGLNSGNESELLTYGHLSVLCFRLGAAARMNRFLLKSEKLKRFWDVVKAFSKKKQRADRLMNARADITQNSSSAFFISDRDLQQDQQHREFILQEAEDSVIAMDDWRKAQKLQQEIQDGFPNVFKDKIETLPVIEPLSSKQNLYQLANSVRDWLKYN